MKGNLQTFLALALITAEPSLAQNAALIGEPYRSVVPIIWAATNALPQSILVCKVASNSFSQAIISNAMAIGSFQLINRMPWHEKSALHFRDKRESWTRVLTITPRDGSISYYDKSAEGTPVRGVPSAERLDDLALTYLVRLGGDTNQVLRKRRAARETVSTGYDKPGGRELSKEVWMRGATLDRQIEDIEDLGSSFMINFGNESKPSSFEFKWRNLRPHQRFPTPTPEQIVKWINSGRATVPPSVWDPAPAVPAGAKSLTITKIKLFYPGKGTGEIVYPVAELELVVDLGNNSKMPFYLNCPVIDVELG